MPTVNMKQMLKNACDNSYAIGTFNILDYNSMKAVVNAAEELKAPVIVQTSVKTVLFWGYSAVISWYLNLAKSSSIPVALHLDHCKELDVIKKCIDTGWTSVMIDASSRPFEENLALSRQVVEMARPHNVTVEAELGAIVGVEDEIHVKDQDSHLADVDQSVQMCRECVLDCFAPAVGTAHGLYKGEPKIDFKRLEEISKKTKLPLALHGGTGLSDHVFKKAISSGCAKINISTQLKYLFIDSFNAYCNANSGEYNPLKVLQAQYLELKNGVIEKIKLFGSAGRAE